ADPSLIRAADSAVLLRGLNADQVLIHEAPREEDRYGLYLEFPTDPDRRQLLGWLQKALALEDHLGFAVPLVALYLRRGERSDGRTCDSRPSCRTRSPHGTRRSASAWSTCRRRKRSSSSGSNGSL